MARSLSERIAARLVWGPVPEYAPELGRCLLWTGATYGKGYGKVGRGRRGEGAVDVHRAVYELCTGEPIPEGMVVDHRCRVQSCARFSHLRAATQKQNTENTVARAGGTSRHRGVSWDADRGKWTVHVGHQYRNFYGGSFLDEDEAGEAARLLRLRLHTHNDADRK